MNPGLGQGFVRFNSTNYIILKKLHELGNLRLVDFVEETGIDTRILSTALRRLKVYKFIYKVDLARKYETGERTQQLFGLEENRGKMHKRATEQERMARCRKNIKGKVSSVFLFRGSIDVQQTP